MTPTTRTRRSFLAGTTAVAGALAGCTGSARESVSVLAAGSLQRAFLQSLSAAVTPTLRVEAHGSARCARMVDDGLSDPDVLALADPVLFDIVLDAPWHATFASNAVALAYNPNTAAGRAVPESDRWFEPLVRDGVSVGRTDPDLDPLGYRTLFALDLAAAHYDRPTLAADVRGNTTIYPETELLAQFESGQVDAAFVYRSMAVERDYPVVDLPAAVDLSDPGRAEFYRRASYELPDGSVVRGDAIRYAAWVRTDDDAARDVFATMVESAADYLTGHGFTVPTAYPAYHGHVPDALAT